MLMANLQVVWHPMLHFIPALCSLQMMLLPRDSWEVWPSEPETIITPLLVITIPLEKLVACALVSVGTLQ